MKKESLQEKTTEQLLKSKKILKSLQVMGVVLTVIYIGLILVLMMMKKTINNLAITWVPIIAMVFITMTNKKNIGNINEELESRNQP